MRTLFWNIVFALCSLALTGLLLYLIQYIYFSDRSYAFGIVTIFFAVIAYSNFLAKAYLYTHRIAP